MRLEKLLQKIEYQKLTYGQGEILLRAEAPT